MIQRIQSIYLLLGSVAMFLLVGTAFKFGSLEDQADHVLLAASDTSFADGTFTLDDHMILLIVALACGIIALVSIFLYKRRDIQIQLVKVFILATLFVNGLAGYLIWRDLNIVRENIEVGFDIGPGLALPLVAIILGYLAISKIRKDEKLVKSMNRLR